ncbi:hypothetical protein AGLY_004490 [Aphis glycines]|uniref:C2H2-type domain-containing protein n=1 Tax=Aphis glycines TaxID=307491 RepID=A0A6G0TYD0_APHGL|nr:hypothetical protein AGLY_004490 [Aphis glycines]
MNQITELLSPWPLRETGYRHVDCGLLSPQQSTVDSSKLCKCNVDLFILLCALYSAAWAAGTCMMVVTDFSEVHLQHRYILEQFIILTIINNNNYLLLHEMFRIINYNRHLILLDHIFSYRRYSVYHATNRTEINNRNGYVPNFDGSPISTTILHIFYFIQLILITIHNNNLIIKFYTYYIRSNTLFEFYSVMMGDVTAESPPADDLNNSGSSSSSSSDSDGESSSSCTSSSSSSCSETPNNQCKNSSLPDCDDDTPQSNGQSEWMVCQLCLYKVKTPLQLKQHMRMHTEHKIHRCAICNKTFEQATRLEKHIAIHCGTDNRFECSLCGKVYKLRTQIVSHIAAHKKQNAGRRISYTCHICTKKFSNKSKLKEHVSGHENGTLHSCDVCGRTFKLNSYLVVHKRTHEMSVSYTGDKPFTCSMCNKSFLSKSNLDLHMLVHNYVKKASYSCDICGKIFMLCIQVTREIMFQYINLSPFIYFCPGY